MKPYDKKTASLLALLPTKAPIWDQGLLVFSASYFLYTSLFTLEEPTSS